MGFPLSLCVSKSHFISLAALPNTSWILPAPQSPNRRAGFIDLRSFMPILA
jgi:hypothetical protein